jgi:hypothetical protein
MSGNHAIVAPSSMALTVACKAWIKLSQGLPPEPDTEATLEGNAADWVVKQYAQGNEVAHGTPIPLPGNFTVDYDMIHAAKQWRDLIGYGAISGVPVVCERIHPTDCWGEPDGWNWLPIERVLKVPDFKYGFGVIEVFENWQLVTYTSGLLDTILATNPGLLDSDIWVEMSILQPRAPHPEGPVRKWRVRADQLRQYINIAHDAAVRAWPPEHMASIVGEPEATAGPHCLHCPARGVCRTAQAAASKIVEFVGKSEAVALEPHALGVELGVLETAFKMMDGRIHALKAQAEAYLRSGKRVPNYAMAPTESRLRWNDGVTAAEILMLGQILNPEKPLDLKKPPGDMNGQNAPIVTPTQAIKAGVDAAVISQYASRVKGMKLERESNTAPIRAFGVSST